MFVMIPIAMAGDICEEKLTPGETCIMLTPTLDCSSNYTIFNYTAEMKNGSMTLISNSLYNFTFSEGEGSYLIQLCDNSTREIIVEGEDEMAGLAVVVFLLGIIGALFIIPFKINFSQNQILNDMGKRLCWLLGLILLALSSVIVVSIANIGGFGISSELFRVLWIVEWAAYLFMVWIVLSFQFRLIKLWREAYKKARMGGEE